MEQLREFLKLIRYAQTGLCLAFNRSKLEQWQVSYANALRSHDASTAALRFPTQLPRPLPLSMVIVTDEPTGLPAFRMDPRAIDVLPKRVRRKA